MTEREQGQAILRHKAPADSLLVKRELIFQLAQALGGSITQERKPAREFEE